MYAGFTPRIGDEVQTTRGAGVVVDPRPEALRVSANDANVPHPHMSCVDPKVLAHLITCPDAEFIAMARRVAALPMRSACQACSDKLLKLAADRLEKANARDFWSVAS